MKSAFSLIELAIVLVILGLLISGVTGGARLIEAARIRAISTEYSDYKRSIAMFRALKDRLPGDLGNTGAIGYLSGQTYTATSFATPYNVANILPEVAPFIDLYIEKLIKFKPDNVGNTGVTVAKFANGGLPKGKMPLTSYWWFFYADAPSTTAGHWRNNLAFNNTLAIYPADMNHKVEPLFLEQLDQKIDDGANDGGDMRVQCGTGAIDSGDANYASYSAVAAAGKKCAKLFLNIE
jgi:prepilin-type N-terminal cleavage/methylation domain-containing protein